MSAYTNPSPQTAPKSGARRAKSGMASERKIAKSKNLVCTRCPFYTFDRDALRAHIASVHAGEKVHSCEVCHKRFTYEDSLKRHMNQHQHFIKEFRCQVRLLVLSLTSTSRCLDYCRTETVHLPVSELSSTFGIMGDSFGSQA